LHGALSPCGLQIVRNPAEGVFRDAAIASITRLRRVCVERLTDDVSLRLLRLIARTKLFLLLLGDCFPVVLLLPEAIPEPG
jgi:hypothetical protein